MAQAIYARLNAAFDLDRVSAWDDARVHAPKGVCEDIGFRVHEDLATVAAESRVFERDADGTVFQIYEWLACWQCHIGALQQVRPAVVLGHDAALLFLLPLAVRPTGLRARSNGSARICATTTARCWRRALPSASTGHVSWRSGRRSGNACSATSGCTTTLFA
jgi:CelD/BcsL family acetyltransferase involved in cellulose biosynthesis